MTRFSLFLPEKRGFFLRDLELFEVGRSGRAQLLHTRRIGLRQGDEVRLLGGLKVSTRAGADVGLGALFVVTDEASGVPRTAHLAVRGQAELGAGSNVGVMVTDRRALTRGNDYNTVVALDGAWRGSGELGPLLLTMFSALSMTGAAARDGEAKNASTASLDLAWRGALWRPAISYLFVERDFNAELGFFRRHGMHNGELSLEVEPRIGAGGVERLRLEAAFEVTADDRARELLDWQAAAKAAVIWDEGFEIGSMQR